MYNLRKAALSLILLFSLVTKGLAQCNSSLWSHVYHAYRLQVNDSCVQISGTVYTLINEDDGDIHIRVTVDTQFNYMLNSVNYSGQYGRLVCEPLCVTNPPIQTDAIAPCAGLSNTVYIPAPGEHVIVTGSYVTDNDHGWNEIHPVTSIVVGHLAVNPVTSVTPEITLYPNPASNKVNIKLSEKPSSPVYMTFTDATGRIMGQFQMYEMQHLELNTQYYPTGKYFYDIKQNDRSIKAGSFVIAR